MKNNSIELLAWAAGFADGEASVQMRRNKCRKVLVDGSISISNQVHVVFTIVQVDPSPLARMHEMFGGSFHLRDRHHKNPKHQPAWVWTLAGTQAYEAFKAIRPWLTLKAERVDLAIEFYDKCHHPRGWTANKGGGSGFQKLPPEEVAMREVFFHKMQQLNLRGGAAVAARIASGEITDTVTAVCQ